MKKFISVVLALTMIISMCATVSATPISGYLTPSSGPFLSYTLPVNIEAHRSATLDAYVASPLTIVDSIPSGGIGVDFKTKLDMTQLRTFFSESLPSIYANLDSEAKAEFDIGVVSTAVTVTIEYAGATVANPETAGGLLNNNNDIFKEVSRTFGTDSVVIEYNNNKVGTLTAADLVTNAATYLKDLVFELKDSAVYNAYGTYEVKVTFSGQTAINFTSVPGDEDVVIDYPQSVATYTVSINAPSTGGGGSSYNSIKLETNGGNELKNISVRRGGKVSELPVPVRDGYVFTGWYVDSALTTPFDANTVINRNYTLYAAWVEDNGAAGNGHETPEILNGEDHFAYVVGYPDGTVRPNDNITRAEVTSIFFRLLKDEVRDENLANDNSFNDVNDEDWYNTAISTMAKLGIVKGRTADEFVPNANITRAEFAAICARFDESQYSVVDKFTDIVSHWAEPEIHETAAYGWIKGYEDGTFKPDKAITRAEAMTMINRVLNRVPETSEDLLDDMIVWPDNSDVSAWYYIPVQEATNSHDYENKNHIYEKWTAIRGITDWTKYE